MKKLSKKERGDIVTKGYFHDYLEGQDYVTKEYMDEKFDHCVQIFREMHDDKFQVLFEELRAIREENGRRLEICESRLDRTENILGII